MAKCKYLFCNTYVNKQYKFCYEHRFETYKDVCKIHGKTNFMQLKCMKCEQEREPLFLVTKKRKYYYDKDNKKIDENHYLYNYLSQLHNNTRRKQDNRIKRIVKGAGIYGIFVKNDKYKSGLGKCLYIGQSSYISIRISQHKANLIKARQHINGIRIRKKNASIKTIKKLKTDYKYYRIMDKYSISDLKFVTILEVPYKLRKQLGNHDFFDLLTYCEQAIMNIYIPKYNTFAARPTPISQCEERK